MQAGHDIAFNCNALDQDFLPLQELGPGTRLSRPEGRRERRIVWTEGGLA